MKSKRPPHDLIKSNEEPSDDDMIDASKEVAAAATEKDVAKPAQVLIQEASPDAAPTTDTAWNAMLFNLLLYKARWGDMNVPNNDEYEALYEWVTEQRSLYKLFQEGVEGSGEEEEEIGERQVGGLTPDRISVLDAVGFAWNLRGDVFWQKHYEALLEYKKENGDVKVPRLYSKNPKLGEWVTDQRRQLKAKLDGRPTMMTDERQEKLDELGFLWKVRERADWNDRYEQLLEYKKEHGHCVVPQHYSENRALGKWVAKQREQFRFYHAGKHSFLTEERIDLLKSLGFVWRVKGRVKGGDILDDHIDIEDSMLSAPIKLPKEEGKEEETEEGEDQESEPKKKKRKKKVSPKKVPPKKKPAEVKADTTDSANAASDSKPAAATAGLTAGPVPSMNGMGLLASFSDGITGMSPSLLPGLPSLPADYDQQLLFAEQQHAARASMLENFAARANQQMEFAQQRAMANSQTMADIAAALARQSRFGNGLGPGMGMFNMPGMPLPNMQGDDPEENFRNLSRML